MSIKSFFTTWKNTNLTWAIIEPFVLKLIEKKVPTTVTKLYENLAKYSQPAITSLEKNEKTIINYLKPEGTYFHVIKGKELILLACDFFRL